MYAVLVNGDRRMLQYIMPSIKHRRVLNENDLRVQMAKKQLNYFQEQTANHESKSKKEIIELVNTFLKQIGIGINQNFNNEVKVNSGKYAYRGKISYIDIKNSQAFCAKKT